MAFMRFDMFKTSIAALIVLCLITQTQRADASDLGKALLGVGVGVIGTCAVTGACKRKQQTTRRAPQKSQAWSPARQERASVQRALNDFGFPVGSADGVYGGKTRAGVSQYQAYMGYPPTGELLPYQQQQLLSAHGQLQNGTANTYYPGLVQAEGPGGLLKATADPNYYASRYGNQGRGAESPAKAEPAPKAGNFGNAGNYGVQNQGNLPPAHTCDTNRAKHLSVTAPMSRTRRNLSRRFNRASQRAEAPWHRCRTLAELAKWPRRCRTIAIS